MPETINTKIRGVSHENRQDIIERDIFPDAPLWLEREPNNSYDTNAIAVYPGYNANGEKIGYISRDLASRLAPLLDAGQLIEADVIDITGQGESSLGVNIKLIVHNLRETEDLQRNFQAKPSISSAQSTKKSQKNFFILLILWFFTGYLGGHRLYAGRGSWIYTLTFGYLLIGWIIDFFIILLGRFTDNRGFPIRPI